MWPGFRRASGAATNIRLTMGLQASVRLRRTALALAGVSSSVAAPTMHPDASVETHA